MAEHLSSFEPTLDQALKNKSTGEPAASGPGSTSLVRKATGPRTQQGKDRTKYNAVKQGIFSNVAVLKDESRAEFDTFLSGLREYFLPEGTFEEVLVEKLATLLWRERRLIVADGQVDIRNRENLSVRVSSLLDFSAPIRSEPRRDSDLLLRYETTLNRNIDRTLNQLERHQRMRRGQPVAPSINVNVSSS